MSFNRIRKPALSPPLGSSMTGFLLCHNCGFLYRKNTKIPIGICYQTMGTLSLLTRTSTEPTSLSLPANLLAFLLSWIGRKRGGIQAIGNIVKHSTPAGPRMNGDENGLTNFYAHECENLRFFQNTQWQWGPFELLICLISVFHAYRRNARP